MGIASGARVRANTASEINARVDRATEQRLCYFANHPEEIDQRLAELEREWDVERTLETNAAALVVAGCLLGATVHRRWFVLPALVGGFLMQHSLQGWCPPLPLLRRIGVRTTDEIERERYALKALRGDFEGASEGLGSGGERIRELVEG